MIESASMSSHQETLVALAAKTAYSAGAHCYDLGGRKFVIETHPFSHKQ